MTALLAGLFIALCVHLNTISVDGALVNYMQNTDGKFAISTGPISFDSTAGQLTYGQSQVLTVITNVQPFTDPMPLETDGTFVDTIFTAYSFSGTQDNSLKTLVFAQQYDTSDDVDDVDVLSNVALDAQAFIDSLARDPAEKAARDAASKIFAELADQLVGVSVIQDDSNVYKVSVAFDFQKLIDGDKLDDNIDITLSNLIAPYVGAQQIASNGGTGSGTGSAVASSTTASSSDTSNPSAVATANTATSTGESSPAPTAWLQTAAVVEADNHAADPIPFEIVLRFRPQADVNLFDQLKSLLSPQPESLLESEDANQDEVDRKHRHHRHHHHARFTRKHKLGASAQWQKIWVGNATIALAGGASMGISTSDGVGTLGGILISPGTQPGAKNYRLWALSNFHAAATGDTACQPGKPFTGGVCNILGQTLSGCCLVADQDKPGKGMDASITPIDPNDRPNTVCAQYRTVTQGTPAATVQNIMGVALGKVGKSVTKYGARTGLTTGKLAFLVNSVGQDWTAHGDGLPTFTDDTPLSVPGTVPTGFTGNAGSIAGQISPTSESLFFSKAIRGDIQTEIQLIKNPTTNPKVVYTAAEATTIFDTLWANGKIVSMFQAGGDSGSVALDADNKVVALMSRGAWEEFGTRDLTILGRKWGSWRRSGDGYSIGNVLRYVNKLLRQTSAKLQVDVCTESARPVPPTSSILCSTAALNSDNTCEFPFSCKPGAAGATPACISR